MDGKLTLRWVIRDGKVVARWGGQHNTSNRRGEPYEVMPMLTSFSGSHGSVVLSATPFTSGTKARSAAFKS